MAMCVLTLAIGTALTVVARGFSSIDTARSLSYASQIMQSEFEKMRLEDWGNGTAAGSGTTGVTAYPVGPSALTIASTFYSTGDAGSRMTMTRKVENVHTGMLKITLTIQWKSITGRTLSRSYITYYGKKGLYDFFTS